MTFFPDSFNPSDTTGGTLSNSNTTFTVPSLTSPGGLSRSKGSYSTGQLYFEATMVISGSTNRGVGISTRAATVSNAVNTGVDGAYFILESAAAWATYINGTNEGGHTFSTTTICVAVDLGNQLFWSRPTITANWNGGAASANPATGVGGYSLPFSGKQVCVAAFVGDLFRGPCPRGIRRGGRRLRAAS
jgi:hypothetical protein